MCEVQTLHREVVMMKDPTLLLQRPASLQGLLNLLQNADPQTDVPYGVLHLLQCLVGRLTQALHLASDSEQHPHSEFSCRASRPQWRILEAQRRQYFAMLWFNLKCKMMSSPARGRSVARLKAL